jgi:signal transduction histidine kinase
VILLALTVAAGTLLAGAAGGLVVRAQRTIHARLIGLALLGTVIPLAAVLLSGIAMFHMGADVVILAVCTASASVAVATALLVTASISSPLKRLRAAVRRVAAGDLRARLQEGGPLELADVATAFNEMAAKVEDSFDARRQLVAWASHDLRTPLTGLQATIEAVEDGIVPPDHYTAAMRENVETLRRLVDGLTDLARIDARPLSLDVRPRQIGPIIEGCVTAMLPRATVREIDVESRIEQGLPDVSIHASSIERVLLNLLANAVKFTPPGGSVLVRAERRDGVVEVSVDDSGDGIPPEDADRIFESFWRGDPMGGRRDGEGGLGLAIAKALVEAQEGRITVERGNGGGARLTFTVPVVTDARG